MLDSIQKWNDEPSYPAKIKTVFEKFGLLVPPGSLLENRRTLAHDGVLKSRVDPKIYFLEVTQIVTVLLLRMLNYRGTYYVVGVGESVL